MYSPCFASLAVVLIVLSAAIAQDEPATQYAAVPETNRVRFEPTVGEDALPENFRLPAHEFEAKAVLAREFKSVRMYKVTFPSPVETDVPANGTVHAEYFQPRGVPKRAASATEGWEGTKPGVIVLHILGGDFLLSESIAEHLAKNGIAAMFVKLPYYGERRGENRRRMITKDPRESAEGMRQAVLDIRRAVAWLGDRPEVDERRLGITGISLGGIMSALAAGVEPRLTSVAVYLGGGDFGNVLWNLSLGEAAEFRKAWEAAGETRDSFCEILRPVDPVTYGPRLRGRRVLMVNASDDEVIPKGSTEALWNSIGKPDIVWLDAGHYTAARYLPLELTRLQMFFQGKLKPALVLNLETVGPTSSEGESRKWTATLTNVGVEPVAIVVPLKSADPVSRWSRWQVGDGTELQKPTGESADPQGQVVAIAPGERYRLGDWIGSPEVPRAAGRHAVTLRYTCSEKDLRGLLTRPDASTQRVRIRPVEVVSNPLEIVVEKVAESKSGPSR